MLVLSRRREEEITFGDGSITLKVLKVEGNTVKLGIKAPREVPITRPDANGGPPTPCDDTSPSPPPAEPEESTTAA